MKLINKNDIELALDIIDGTRKLPSEDIKSFLYDMRLSLLNDSLDAQDLAQAEIEKLKKEIEELESENDELRDRIYELQ